MATPIFEDYACGTLLSGRGIGGGEYDAGDWSTEMIGHAQSFGNVDQCGYDAVEASSRVPDSFCQFGVL